MILNENLNFDNRSIHDIVQSLSSKKTLVVIDAYHAKMLAPASNVIVVKDNTPEFISQIRESREFEHVIGVGTCTALDMAKAIGVGSQGVFIVPAVLSTACISNNKSVIRKNGESRAIVTSQPKKTIIPVREIMKSSYAIRSRTNSSAFGDILARFGALADYCYRRKLELASQLDKISDTVEALEWVETSFSDYNEDCIRKLGYFSHQSSLVTMFNNEIGQSELNVGSEHAIYYWLVDHVPLFRSTRYTGRIGKWRYHFDALVGNSKIPTHGEIVAVGTLLSLRIEAETSGDFEVFNRVKKVFQQLGLPVSSADLSAINIDYTTLELGMKGVSSLNGIYQDSVQSGNFDVIKRAFP